MLLEQYGAADIVVPEVALERSWPGGPVTGRFVARHGPDGTIVASFTLRSKDSAGLPRMLDEGVSRIDEAYSAALREGRLSPDSSLILQEEPSEVPVEDALVEDVAVDASAAVPGATYTIEVETPDAAALGAAEQALRAVPGVRSAATTSMALGGVSLMRLTFDGDLPGLTISLAARGWRTEQSGGTLRIRRQAPATPPAQPAAPVPAPPARRASSPCRWTGRRRRARAIS